MKRLLLLPIVILVMCLSATPVLAADPPDMDVDIDVYTPGDANVDISAQAGGDLNVSVNGEGLATDTMVQDAYNSALAAVRNATSGGAINSHDWWRYKSKYLDPLFADLFQNANVTNEQLSTTMNAVAHLIAVSEVTAEVNSEQDERISGIGSDLEDTKATMDKLKAQDEKTWDQLMNGAEYHLSLLDVREAEDVARLEADNAQLREDLNDVSQNHQALSDYLGFVSSQYLYYIWILSGASVVLLLLVVGLLVGVIRHSRNRVVH